MKLVVLSVLLLLSLFGASADQSSAQVAASTEVDEAVAALESFATLNMDQMEVAAEVDRAKAGRVPTAHKPKPMKLKLVNAKTGKPVKASNLQLTAVNSKTGKKITPKSVRLTPIDSKTGKPLQNTPLKLTPVDSKSGKPIKAAGLALTAVDSKNGRPIKPAALILAPIDPKTGNTPKLSWPQAVPQFEDDEITAPANLGHYKVFQKGTVNAKGFDVRFAAKGVSDVMIAFMCEEESRSDEAYEIVLGAFGGSRSVVRFGTQGKVLGYRDEDRHAERPRVYPDEFTTYWVSYLAEDKIIDVYTGTNNAPIMRGFKVPPLPCTRLKVAYGAWEKPVTFANRYVYNEDLNKEDHYDFHFQALKAMDKATGDQAAHEARENARREQAKAKELDRKRTLRAIKVQKAELALVKKGELAQHAKLVALQKQVEAKQRAIVLKTDALAKKEAAARAAIAKKEAALKAKEASLAAKAAAIAKKDLEFRKKRLVGLKLKAATQNGALISKKNIKLHPVDPATGGYVVKKPTLKLVNDQTGRPHEQKPKLHKVQPNGQIDKPTTAPSKTKVILSKVVAKKSA